MISGDSSGNIIVWGRDKRNIFYVKHTIIRAHEKSVFSLAHLQDGTLVSGGGLDRRIIAWDGAQDYRSAKAGRQVSYFRSNHTISLVKQSSKKNSLKLITSISYATFLRSLRNNFQIKQLNYAEIEKKKNYRKEMRST